MEPEDHAIYQNTLDRLLQLGEREWIEFKENNSNPDEIGKRLSALANGASLHGRENGYLIYGVQDATLAVVGTSFQPRTRVNVNEIHEVRYWTQKFNYILEQLRAAVAKAGIMSDAMELHLRSAAK